MPLQVPPAMDVLLLVFLGWATGTMVGAGLSRLGGQVHAGHFKVVWLVGAGLAAVAAVGYPPAWVLVVLCLATFGSIYVDHDLQLGLTSAGVAPVALLLGGLAGDAGRWALSGFLVAAAGLLGSVTNAMLLGHWHLNQPRLGTGPIRAMVWGVWGSLAAYVLACALILVAALGEQANVAVLGAVTAGAFAVFAAVLNAMVTHLVKIRSIMSATGILYLMILLAFVAAFTGTLAAMSPGLY